MSPLATLSDLKLRLGLAESDIADDALLDSFLASVSARFEKECNRLFGRVAGATYEFPADVREIVPSLYPIESITAWHLKSNETDGWVAQTGIDFLIRRGCIVSLPSALGSWQEQGRMTYDAGYVLPDATVGTGQTVLPSDIEQAAIEQCAYWYQNRNRLGLTSISGDGGAISTFAQPDLLPNVRAVLKRHERWVN